MTTVHDPTPRAACRTAADGRTATFRRTVEAAARQLETDGEAGLSLRSVARAVGVSVQSLYHYVDSRAALVDVLVEESADALATVVAEAVGTRADGSVDDLVAAARAFHRWARAHPAAFSLLHGRGLCVDACGCAGTAPRLRRTLLGVLGDARATGEALVPFWAVVSALAARRHHEGRSCDDAWEPLVRGAAAAVMTARGAGPCDRRWTTCSPDR